MLALTMRYQTSVVSRFCQNRRKIPQIICFFGLIRAHHHCDKPRFALLPVVVCEQWWRPCFSLLWPGEDQQTRQPCAFPAGDSSQPSAFHLLSFECRSGAHGSPKEQIKEEMAAVAPVSPPGCLSGGSRLFSTRPAQVRRCHFLLESALLARAGCPRR